MIFINRAPFKKLELHFEEKGIAILESGNGKGKTTILSHIVDALYEFAKSGFESEFKGKETGFYRVSSNIYLLDPQSYSIVYIRFLCQGQVFDYLDARRAFSQENYEEVIKLTSKIPYGKFCQQLEENGFCKTISENIKSKNAIELFNKHICTFFPSYRYERPSFLNDIYQIQLGFTCNASMAGYLKNPIEVRTTIDQLANWIMDTIVDNQYANIKSEDIEKTLELFKQFSIDFSNPGNAAILISRIVQLTLSSKVPIRSNLNKILSSALFAKGYGDLRFGIGARNDGGSRIQIVRISDNQTICPTIFNLSSGELAVLCLFAEIIRQAVKINPETPISNITGLVLVDEIEEHLHIKLQKEVLPRLLELFPNIQFIISSHSPFFPMGLAEVIPNRSVIIDLDNMGITRDPTTNAQYNDVYNMMVRENERFLEKLKTLEEKLKDNEKSLIITEGPTDVCHLKAAIKKLGFAQEIDFLNYDTEKGWGSSELMNVLKSLSKISNQRKIIIGVFDRDEKKVINDIEGSREGYKSFGNRVYAFCLPVPNGREQYENISIEFYWPFAVLSG